MPANPGLPLLTCELCSFSTKNAYMFKRHTNRCRRDHGLPAKKKKKRPVAPKPVEVIYEEKVKSVSVLQMKKYTYTCATCQFTTSKSRVYLDHKNDVHGENNIIYDCRVCEYASKWKSKLTNHQKMFHPDHVPEPVPVASQSDATVEVGPSETPLEPVEAYTVEPGSSKIAKSNKFKKGLKLKIKFKKNSNLPPGAATSLVIDVTESQDNPLFKCKLCSFSARRKWKVYKHAKAGHLDTKKLRCPICSHICFGKNEYQKHKQNHSTKIMFKCNECSYTTHLKPNYERHLRSHNRNLEFKCEYCSYSSTNQGAVKRHTGTQHIEGDGEVVLPEADDDEMETEGEQSIIGDDMEVDKESKEPIEADESPLAPEVLKCTYCGFLPREEEDYKKHMARHKKGFYYPCQLCGHVSRYNSDINRHFREKHDTRLKIFIQSQGVTSFVYTSPKKHTITKPAESRSFADELLDLPVRSYRTLIIGGKERIKCTHCSYIAKWPCDLRRHLSVHSIEKRYKCPKCMKKYKYLGDLNVHLRRDHKIDPSILGKVQAMSTMAIKRSSPKLFRCPTCPYKSQCKSEMDRHSRLHSDEKPFQCKECEYKTHWRSDIRRHVYRHHLDVLKGDNEVDQFIIIRRDLLKAYKKQQNSGSVPSPLTTANIKMVDIKEEQTADPEDPDSSDSDAAINSSDDDDEDDISFGADAETSNAAEIDANQRTMDDMDDRRSITSVPSKEGSVPRDGSVLLKCEYCDFTANAASKMNAHVATHLNMKRFRCPVCGKRSNWKWDISKHMRNAHRSCRLPVEVLTQEEAEATIKVYMDTNPTIKREHHLNSGHSKPVPKSDVKKPFKCSLCDYKSHIRWDISRHLRTLHSGEEGSIIISIDPEALREVMNSPQKVVTPSIVVKIPSVIQSPSMVNSLSLDKSPSKRIPLEKQRVASSASEGLPSPQFLKEAARRGEKNFKCGDCGKRTTTKGDIKKHYHYMHPGMLIRIMYVGNTAKSPTIHIGIESPVVITPKPVAPVATTPPVVSMVVKQETCYSDPKKLGYIKPFKCSVCGRRSNWKWDCNKHIRICHADTDAYVITMSEDEARMNPTPKIQNTTALLNSASSSTSGDQESIVSANSINRLSDGEQSMDSDGTPVLVEEKLLRRFQCSVCLSRSNWRSDLHRHIKSKHGGKGRIIILDLDVAQASLESYRYTKERQQAKIQTKYWKCIRCPYKNEERLSVVNHLSVHNVKPFSCKLCGAATNYRSAMYRHIRHRHGKNDFTLCTVNLRHIREGESIEQDAWNEDTDGAVVGLNASGSDRSPGVIHHCKLCAFQSSWKSALHRHLREKHACTDYGLCTTMVNPQPGHSEFKVPWTPLAQQLDPKKKYSCIICPYRSAKPSLLNFHMTHHKSKGQGKYKCKYCPYWVCARRLAVQHQKLHTGDMSSKDICKSPSLDDGASSSTPRRHICDKCPYTTNSKNDYLYHKQFHRPKPVAEYKCDYCDYWVTHKRLLKQHLKIHNVFLPDNDNEVCATPYAVEQSPCKSEFSETSIVYDAVEIASIKQRMITAKITASLSQGPMCSPLKVPHCTVIASRPGYLLKNGVYRKLHKCRFCPYTNVRTRNLRLHEKMHGRRKSDRPLMKCLHCDYYVGARGLLSHHLKVHQQQYVPDVMDTTVSELEREEAGYQSFDDMDERESDISDVQYDNKVDTMLEIARFKKWCCEKCPYASARRTHFERHLELHGSKQRYMCEFCDYSVPSSNLLAQHKKLHMMPNQNLLAVQSILNLQHLPEVPADMMLASSLPRVTDSKEPVTYNITHDHMDLYENAEQDTEPRKLYRCDRCPYANVRRDHLLAHIKNHMIRSELACPYCDYSVAKQHHLVQHIRVHFSPLPELSNWLCENGQSDRAEKDKYQDISEAITLAQVFQKSGTENSKEVEIEPNTEEGDIKLVESGQTPEAMEADHEKDENVDASEVGQMEKGEMPKSKDPGEAEAEDGAVPSGSGTQSEDPEDYICQYCDRVFALSEQLIRHELQHLIGNQFEVSGIWNIHDNN